MPVAFLGLLSACQTFPQGDDQIFYSQADKPKADSEFEQAQLIPTRQFLSPICESECVYKLHGETYNDGISNIYRVTYDGNVFVIQGTAEASELLNELGAVEELKRTGSLKLGGDAVQDRTKRLVTTPYQIGKSIYRRFDAVENVADAALIMPTTAVEISKGLLGGTQEIGVTALRLTDNLSHTTCEGLACVQDTVEDVWYGLNILTGKHKEARDLHRIHGTDSETLNPLLKQEINRHAYVSSLTQTGFKYALGAASIPAIAETSTAIGYYRNTSFLSRYEDARKQETLDKKQLADWGVSPKIIGSFYANPAFTHESRSRLIHALSGLDGMLDVTLLMSDVSHIDNRYIGNNTAALYTYAANIRSARNLCQVSVIPQGLLAYLNNGDRIYIFKADYVIWSKEMAELLSSPQGRHPELSNNAKTELHVLGQMSDVMRVESEKHGFLIVQ